MRQQGVERCMHTHQFDIAFAAMQESGVVSEVKVIRGRKQTVLVVVQGIALSEYLLAVSSAIFLDDNDS